MMSNRIFTIIFIIVVVAIIVFATYFIRNKNNEVDSNNSNNNVDEIAVVENMKMGISNYDTMNPYLTGNREIINLDKIIFEPLVNITSDYHLENCLATSINKTDDTTYEVKVDNSIKWQNGTNLSAEDVKFSIDKLKEKGSSVYSANVSPVESVEVSDDTTAIIHLNRAYNFFEYNLSFPIICSSYYVEEDFDNSTKIPIGTGMYKIASIDNDNIFLIINDKWHKLKTNKPRTNTITIHRYSAIGEMYNAFKLGNIDIISTSMTNYADYVGTMGYSVKNYVGKNFDFLTLNCDDSVLSDVHVRRALAYAINKDNLNGSVYGNGKAVANTVLDYGSYLNSNENIVYFNETNAKSELGEAGYSESSNGWTKDGRTLNITLTVSDTNQGRIDSANNIKNQLNNIGIKVKLNVVSNEIYLNYINNRNYQVMLTGIQESVNPNLNYFFGEGNLANYNVEENFTNVNNLDTYQEMIKNANYDVPYIGLYRNKGMLILNANVGGEFASTNYNIYNNFDKWYRQQ